MYLPASFRIDDPQVITAFVREHSFATLITHDAGAPFASHLPMLLKTGASGPATLWAHIARANPQWRHFANGQEALAIFTGPHTYISPSWYRTTPAVPTWNYTAVHAYGIPRVIEDPQHIASALAEMIDAYESGLPAPWSGQLPDAYREQMLRGIVAFEIPVSRFEAKFKLSQNRSAEDVASVIAALDASGDPDAVATASMMRVASGNPPH